MLQRVQSLFLLGVVLSMGALLVLKIWVKSVPDGSEYAQLTAYSLLHQNGDVVEETSVIYIAGLAILAMIVGSVSIFKYSNRLTQIKLNLLNTLLITGTLGTMVYTSLAVGEKLFDETIQGAYQMGFYIPVAALFFNSLANRYIKKDEDLVRSADRLR